ncbi:MAG: cytochrome P450 [Pyrinomonadaceae bacterium]|nr:cytochrome P450 [Pyrinomonadaceae bacterium]
MAEKHLPPSTRPGLLGGHFIKFRRRPTEFLTELSSLGDITYFRLFRNPTYFLNHPDLIRDVLIKNNTKFVKGRALQRAKNLLGEGLLTSEGEKHLRQRRMIQPAFHHARIAEYAKSMTEYAERMSNEWRDGEVRDIDKEMMGLTLQIVGKTLFNADVDDETDEIGNAMTTLIEMFDYLVMPFSEILEKLPFPQSIRFHRSKKTLDRVIYEIIDERRKSGKDEGDLLSMLLLAQDEDDGKGMSDKQIRDEALTLFLAGHETTANAMTFTWYLLSQNPDKEAKLKEELDRVVDGKTPSMEDVRDLKYTEAVFAEAMRLFPPAWAIGRLAIEEHRFGDYDIPKDALVLLSPYVTQRDPRFWDDAGEFIPERWEKQSIKEAGQKFIYFPFSRGVRSCIGESFAWMEGILLIATLAQKWKLELIPEQKIALNPVMTLRPKYGMKMKIRKR